MQKFHSSWKAVRNHSEKLRSVSSCQRAHHKAESGDGRKVKYFIAVTGEESNSAHSIGVTMLLLICILETANVEVIRSWCESSSCDQAHSSSFWDFLVKLVDENETFRFWLDDFLYLLRVKDRSCQWVVMTLLFSKRKGGCLLRQKAGELTLSSPDNNVRVWLRRETVTAL